MTFRADSDVPPNLSSLWRWGDIATASAEDAGSSVGNDGHASGVDAFVTRPASFTQGAEWKTLISRYIGTMPLNGDAPCAAEQRISAGPPCAAVCKAMSAKTGVAARLSQ